MKPRRISRFNDDLKGKRSAAFMFQMNKIRKFRKETGARREYVPIAVR